VILERFNFGEYEKTLRDFSLRPSKAMFSFGKRKGITEKKVVIMITMIREEAAHFNVDITD
jgi:hypothetical protein